MEPKSKDEDPLLLNARKFLESPEDNDSLSKVLDILSDAEKVTTLHLEAIGSVPVTIITRYRLLKNKNDSKKSLSPDEKNLMDWFHSSHDVCLQRLGNLCKQSAHIELRPVALKAILDLIPLQAKCFVEKQGTFPVKQFSEILRNIILAEGAITSLLDKLKEYWVYADVTSNLWKSLEMLSNNINLSSANVHNILLIIGTLEKPSAAQKTDLQFFTGCSGCLLGKKSLPKVIMRLWEKLMTTEVQPVTKQLLVFTLIEHLMPRMDKPIFLTDYFMSCLDSGGPLSLLGLQGIFILIQKHNINYPNVYTKLYSLFTQEMFSTPYKARLYYLSDIFLTSTHLPQAMVAGFVKRLARLSLRAPPADIIIMMAFITNLIIRHPGIKRLIHNTNDMCFESDPYVFEEKDPSKSNGLASSLWEVQLLQHHVLPSVSAAAMFISNPLPSVEHDLGILLEVTSSDIFQREYKKKVPNTPVSFEKPVTLWPSQGECGQPIWNISG